VENLVRLSISGMHCDGCVRRVTQALNSVEGVRVDSVQVGSATVVADFSRLAPEQILASIDRIGFTAHIER
jgi:copper chaperone